MPNKQLRGRFRITRGARPRGTRPRSSNDRQAGQRRISAINHGQLRGITAQRRHHGGFMRPGAAVAPSGLPGSGSQLEHRNSRHPAEGASQVMHPHVVGVAVACCGVVPNDDGGPHVRD